MNYSGNVKDVFEAFALIEASQQNLIFAINSRIGRQDLTKIHPGSTFIFNRTKTQMKRWIDGKSWSPSRFRKGFFEYSEVCVDDSFSYTGLCKKVISIKAPNGDLYHLVNYFDNNSNKEINGVLDFLSTTLAQESILKEARKYNYFKCFRKSSSEWRKPCQAPTRELKIQYFSESSPLKYQSSSENFSSESSIIKLPPIQCPDFFSHRKPVLSEDQRQLNLLSKNICF